MTKHAPQHRFRERLTVTQPPRIWVLWTLGAAFITGVASGVAFYLLHPSVHTVMMGTVGVLLGIASIGVVIQAARTRVDRPLARFSVRGLTGLAALLAGRKRPALRAEWRAHLAGESGHDPVTWRKIWQALGFVASAIQVRLADAADLAWRPADAVLGSRALSSLFVWGPVIAMLFAIVHHDGRFGLVADIQDPAALGAFLYGVIRTGRWWRGVKPPEPKAKRTRE